MGKPVNPWLQMEKQRANLQKKVSKYQALVQQRQEQSEEYLLGKLSKEMGFDLKKVVEEIEKRADADRKSIQPQLKKLKTDVKHFAIQHRRRLDQAIMTYAKQGIIDGYLKRYPNPPDLRMKYAYDWEGTCDPDRDVVPGMTPEYWSCDYYFDQELDSSGDPLIVGDVGLCKRFRAHCIADVGDERRGRTAAATTQTLIFSHDPPSSNSEQCYFVDLWMPISLTGISHASHSDATFFFLTDAYGGGGFATIRLSIRIEQDTDDHGLIVYPITDEEIYRHEDRGGIWFFGGARPVDWAPHPITLLLDAPYRLPPVCILYSDAYGGREVRVIVTLTCSTTACHRNAEAEIDLASAGFGVEVHEVLLRGAGCVGPFPDN